jgi:hypothetical protein
MFSGKYEFAKRFGQKIFSFSVGSGVLSKIEFVRFEVFTAVTMRNGVFWNVTQCGSGKNRRFGGT